MHIPVHFCTSRQLSLRAASVSEPPGAKEQRPYAAPRCCASHLEQPRPHAKKKRTYVHSPSDPRASATPQMYRRRPRLPQARSAFPTRGHLAQASPTVPRLHNLNPNDFPPPNPRTKNQKPETFVRQHHPHRKSVIPRTHVPIPCTKVRFRRVTPASKF